MRSNHDGTEDTNIEGEEKSPEKQERQSKPIRSYLFLAVTDNNGDPLDYLNEDPRVLLSADVFGSEVKALQESLVAKIRSPIMVELNISKDEAKNDIAKKAASDLAHHVTAIDHMPVEYDGDKFRHK